MVGFAKSDSFNSESAPDFKPFEPVESTRKRFEPDTKVMFAIGGWGDTEGFGKAIKDEKTIEQYAKNVATVVKDGGFDGVDIDWEYPGGNGDDYKKVPNSDKKPEIDAFPKFLAAIRKEITKEKILSIATPGKKIDMIAYTKEHGKAIGDAVDMVNVMSYDLINRRNKESKHASSVTDTQASIQRYKDIGIPADKLNVGFAYYAKWFQVKDDEECKKKKGLGCKLEDLETKDGGDTGKSGVLTFEKGTMASVKSDDLKESTDGSCGYGSKTKCPDGQCCSQYGTW